MLEFTPEPQSKPLSVEQLNLQIKQLMEGNFATVWVKAEISNFKPHSSGHFYFSLKDQKSQISAVMFRGYNSKLKFRPEDGMEVVVRGRISVYEPRGNYQILCDYMEPVGAGALQKAFEQLKIKLKNEGLFDLSRKKQIPTHPSRIAIVTSPTGAAIQDILNILGRRAPQLEVIVVPTLVQGAEAAPLIREAFAKAQKIKNVDVIILGRGGGSIEDMWCFNDELLAREIAHCSIPVISAVGHEIDFTICDFVADLRAPTPSAAAELVAQSSAELKRRLSEIQKSLGFAISRKVKELIQKIDFLSRSLVDPQKYLQDLSLRNDDLMRRLEMILFQQFAQKKYEIKLFEKRLPDPTHLVENMKQVVSSLYMQLGQTVKNQLMSQKKDVTRFMQILDSLSPLKVVDRGYAILSGQHEVIQSISQVKVNDQIHATLKDGKLQLSVINIQKGEMTDGI
ncbi:MAG: exodeoxyribonuclease VII large subunit [Pseudobdellovibrionaceae bacterium]